MENRDLGSMPLLAQIHFPTGKLPIIVKAFWAMALAISSKHIRTPFLFERILRAMNNGKTPIS
jgi:hypothetical protein